MSRIHTRNPFQRHPSYEVTFLNGLSSPVSPRFLPLPPSPSPSQDPSFPLDGISTEYNPLSDWRFSTSFPTWFCIHSISFAIPLAISENYRPSIVSSANYLYGFYRGLWAHRTCFLPCASDTFSLSLSSVPPSIDFVSSRQVIIIGYGFFTMYKVLPGFRNKELYTEE